MAYYKVDRSFNVKAYTATTPVSVSTSNFVTRDVELAIFASSSLDSLIARTWTGLSAKKILRLPISFIRLFTFNDAILKPRFAGREFVRQVSLEAAVLCILLKS